MTLEQTIRELAESSLLSEQQFVVDVIVTARKGPKKVLIIVDGDEGINIDDCATVSREVSAKLDEREIMKEEQYLLEVSTPGLDQPLKLTRQYRKNIGRSLKVKLADKIIEGKLEAATDEKIVINQTIGTGKKKETKSVEINLSEVEKAIVQVSFK